MKIPARYSNVLFGGMLTIIMVIIISGTVVLINQGFDAEFFRRWFKGFITAWPVAFASVLVAATFRAQGGGEDRCVISTPSSRMISSPKNRQNKPICLSYPPKRQKG